MKTNYSISRGLLKGLAVAALALGFSASVTAQDAPRKTWDFTKGWSAETVANLEADADWALHDTEFAYKSPKGMEGALTVKDRTTGETINIPEFDGLKFVKASKQESYSVRFYTLQTYNSTEKTGQDDPHFRLTVKDEGFTIPGLTAGQTITVYGCSCQPAQTANTRGIYCKDSYVEFVAAESTGTPNNTNNGCTFNGISDITKIPTSYYAVTWKVKDDAEGPVDVTILAGPTEAGVAINMILVDGGDEAGGEDDMELLVVSPDGEEDDIYFAVQEGYNAKFVKSLSELEEGTTLADFDAILVSNKQKEDSNNDLRKALAFYPMVNLSAELVKAWGLGTVAESETGSLTVAEADLESALYSDLTIEDGQLELVAEGVLPVVTPGDYLAKDAVLATVGDKAYILQHNPGRNTHILI
ncbi:MAG: hypothetical protein K2K72_00125, partial [Duncaniella sp.]|nr:hypothetical protein [Duncaniella sp.]